MSDVAISEARAPLRLPSYALFAAMLAAAGLPIYIHAPKFYVDTYGLTLTALGSVLFLLRLIDFIQDPLFGWLSERTRHVRRTMVAGAVGLMAASMYALFAVDAPIAPIWWFALSLTGLFSAFSFLTISFYAQGVIKAESMGAGHFKLATWRETGALLGVCLAAIAPTVLLGLSDQPFAAFATGFAVVCIAAMIAMSREWGVGAVSQDTGFGVILGDAVTRRLLLLALINATPVAVTSTLFLFFVESLLEAPGWEGPLLLLFFLAAAISAPVWGWVAGRIGAKAALLSGMALAIVTFGFAMTLGAGDTVAFAIICVTSGAALGADLTLLPAIFARRMARIAPNAGQAFGLWSFVSKFTLAFAAVSLLPLLDASGFVSGTASQTQPASALQTLTILYAVVPCVLKCVALLLLWATDLTEDEASG